MKMEKNMEKEMKKEMEMKMVAQEKTRKNEGGKDFY